MALCSQIFRDGVRLVTRIGDADKTVDGVSYKCISDEPLPPSHPSPLNGTTVWSYTWCAKPPFVVPARASAAVGGQVLHVVIVCVWAKKKLVHKSLGATRTQPSSSI